MTTPENPTVAEIRAELARLRAALRAKGYAQPWAEVWIDPQGFTVRLASTTEPYAEGAQLAFVQGQRRVSNAFAFGETLEAALKDADRLIAAVPTEPSAEALEEPAP